MSGKSKEVEQEGNGGQEEHDHSEEVEEEVKFVPGKKVSLQEQLEMDKDDESLRKWKEQLLGSVSVDAQGAAAEAEVTFLAMRMLVEGRDPVDVALPPKSGQPVSSTPPHFVLREKSTYRLQFEFTVKNEIVLGLTYWRKVYRLGAQVDKVKLMLGSYGPQTEPYKYETQEEETPHGILARGKYTAKTGFTDDDGKTYLEMDYTFEIKKDW